MTAGQETEHSRPRRWHELQPWHTNAALILIGLTLIGFTRQLIKENDGFIIGNAAVSCASITLYFAALLILFIKPANVDRYTLPIILFFAIVCRLVTLFPDPFLSTDVYRYAWDGVVQHAGINPYRYVPGDPALSFLRKPAEDLYANMNRRDYAHTIYPPVAQILFFLITWISPAVTGMKAAMVLFEGLTAYGLLQLLKAFGMRRERLIIYAWCPLLIWEIAGSGHLDSAAIAFIVFALLFRLRGDDVLVGVFLGLAFLTKFYPIVLFPALYRRGDWKMPAVIAAMTIAAYSLYLSAGRMVFGFLGGYVQEEGMSTGSRYFLLEFAQHIPGLHALPNGAFLAFAAVMFLVLMAWCWRVACQPNSRPAAFLPPAFALACALMLLFSPHYPWYIAWLIPFLVLLPNITVFTYVGLFFYLCYTALAVGTGPKQYHLNEILYTSLVAAALAEAILRRLPQTRGWFEQIILRQALDAPPAEKAPA